MRLAARSPVVMLATTALVAGSLVLPLVRSRADVVTNGPVQRLSVATGGKPANGDSDEPVVAARNPSVVAFESSAANLGTKAEQTDAYVNKGGTIIRLAAALPDNWVSAGSSGSPSLSADGRYVAFIASAYDSSRPTAQTAIAGEVFVRDLTAPKAVHIGGYDTGADAVVISPDGGYVAFTKPSPSLADTGAGEPDIVLLVDLKNPVAVQNLFGGAPGQTGWTGGGHPVLNEGASVLAFSSRLPLMGGDTNAASDIFTLTGPPPAPGQPAAPLTAIPGDQRVLTRVSIGPGDRQGNGPSRTPSISGDGTKVAFESFADNLVDGDDNGTADIFVRDRAANTTTLVSRTSGDIEGNGPSTAPSISLDGRYVAFASAASNLVANDTNGADPTNATQTNFELIDAAGNSTYATSVTAADPPGQVNHLRAKFPRGVAQAVGIRVNRGAVIDEQVSPLTVFDGRSNANPLGVAGRVADTLGTPVLTTIRPDLTAVNFIPETEGYPNGIAVDFCFDAVLDGLADKSRFHLQGYDSAVFITADRATLKSDSEPNIDGHCARVGFNQPTPISTRDFPVGVVDADAVTGAGSGNLAASLGTQNGFAHSGAAATLRRNAKAGPRLRVADAVPFRDVTTAPEAIAVSQNPTTGSTSPGDQNNLIFTFDQYVAHVNPNTGTDPFPLQAGFYDEGGRIHRATSTDSQQGTQIIVHFANTDPVTTAVRYFILGNGLRGRTIGPGFAPTDTEYNISQASNESTGAPDLTGATPVPSATSGADAAFDLTLDDAVASADPSKIAFYAEDGTRFNADSAQANGTKTVHVTAPVAAFLSSVVLMTAEPGWAHQAPSPTARDATAGSVELGSVGYASGRTDAPDLIADQVPSFDPATNTAVFSFDEAVRADDVQLSPPSPVVAPISKDIFERDLVTGRTGRASLSADGSEANGDSNAPSITADGRYVAFDSAATNLLSGDDPKVRDIFRRDMLTARTDPELLDFSGPVSLGSRSATRSITLTNDGFGPLHYGGATISGNDYTVVDDGCRGKVLQPTETCKVGLAFTPHNPGARPATLTVTDDDVGSPRRISLTGIGEAPPIPGVTYTPSLSVQPVLGPAGTVAEVSGQNYRPDIALRLQWGPDPSLPTGPTPVGSTTVLATDDQGRFGPVPILVFHHDILGPRVVQTSGTLPDATATAPFLVVPGTMEPAGKDVVSLLRQVQLLGRR